MELGVLLFPVIWQIKLTKWKLHSYIRKQVLEFNNFSNNPQQFFFLSFFFTGW